VVRFHNIFGPLGTYDGGREKSPAAICRKIALANDGDDIEVWGDGGQTRSYCYIDDCVEGIYRLMQSDHHEPINLGQDRMISINELVDIVAQIAGKRIGKRYDTSKPQGVRGRNSDNTRLREVLQWEPEISLEDGLARTYHWIAGQLKQKRGPGCSYRLRIHTSVLSPSTKSGAQTQKDIRVSSAFVIFSSISVSISAQ